MDFDTPNWNADDKTDPGLTAPAGATDAQEPHDAGPSRLQLIGIAVFAVAAFFFFLVMKLPEARIQNLVIAHIRIIAQEQGFLFSAEKVRVGMLLGPSLKMYNVELKAIENERQVLKIPFLKLRPKLFSMLGAVKKVGISAELLEGELSGTVGAGATGSMHVDLSIDSIDLGATNLMKKFLPVDLTAKLDGKVQLELDGETPTKSDGLLKLKIDKLALPAQSVMGLPLSKVNVSEARINVVLSNGKIEFREFEVGKDGKGDDIVGKLTGDGTLNKYLDRSSVNLKALFSISQGVKNSLGILAGMLTPAQTPDGKYAYRISGPLSGLEAMPGQ